MKLLPFVLLFFAAPAPEIRYFHFERSVSNPAQSAGQACFAIDPGVFPNASAQLADLRIYQGQTETPYKLISTPAAAPAGQSIPILNLGTRDNQTVFDAEIPSGPYSDLDLELDGRDFLATVAVSGSQVEGAAARTSLGSFTVFDLTAQKLGRSTTLHLPASDFRYLHFRISGAIAPERIKGLSVLRVPGIQPRYVAVAQSATQTQKDRSSVFQFAVPAHVPVERIVFVPGSAQSNFSRDVRISVSFRRANNAAEPAEPATAEGSILRIHGIRDGRRIDEERLAVDAPPIVSEDPTIWTVSIDNRDDAPLPMASVRLEMLERCACFDAAAGAAYTLYYGDTALEAPQYDYAALFSSQPHAVVAALGPETPNPTFEPRPDLRPFTEKHPALLWAALVLVIAFLGIVAFRSVKARRGDSTP
jgi:hypothetical protein